MVARVDTVPPATGVLKTFLFPSAQYTYVSSAAIAYGGPDIDARARSVVGDAHVEPIAHVKIPRFWSLQKTCVEFVAMA